MVEVAEDHNNSSSGEWNWNTQFLMALISSLQLSGLADVCILVHISDDSYISCDAFGKKIIISHVRFFKNTGEFHLCAFRNGSQKTDKTYSPPPNAKAKISETPER